MKDGKAPRRPSACNLSSIPVLQVVSYACFKSRKAARTLCFTENACRTSWSRRSNGSIVEVERRKPNWKGVRAFNVSRSGESLLDTSRSIILLGTDVIEIGRLLGDQWSLYLVLGWLLLLLMSTLLVELIHTNIYL